MGAVRIYSDIGILPQHDENRVVTFCKDSQKPPHFQYKSEREKNRNNFKVKTILVHFNSHGL